MSRTYYQWMRAKAQWWDEQHYRKAEIPYPIDNAVVYKRQSNNPYWEKRRLATEETIPTSLGFNFTQTDIGQFFYTMGDYEQQKEDEFLSKFYDPKRFYTITSSTKTRTDKFNELFQSQEIYRKVNQRIKNILNKKQNEVNKTFGKSEKTTHEKFTGMAPNLSAVFATYFEKHLAFELQEFYKNIDIDRDSTVELEKRFEAHLKTAVLAASEEMFRIERSSKTEVYGAGDEWAPINELLSENGREMELFMENLKNAIGIENLNTLRDNLKVKKKSEMSKALNKGHIKELMGSNLKNISGRTASIGGSILEPVLSMMANYFNQNSKDFQMEARNFGGSKVVTDAAMLWTTRMDINLDDTMEKLRKALYESDVQKQRQLYSALEKYYDQQKDNLDDLYHVFINAKNYSIGADGRDYTKTIEGNIDELPEFFQSTGVNIKNLNDFFDIVLNTAKGAVREDMRDEVQEQASNALKMAASKLMFDDYQTVGVLPEDEFLDGKRNSIHMFYLSGKYIPSSVVFKSMAKAIKDMMKGVSKTEDTKGYINLPSEIIDHGTKEYDPVWPEIRAIAKDDATFKEQLYQYWLDEAKRLKAEITWKASFTLRIKKLLADSIKQN